MILCVGSTGQLGRMVARELLDRGKQIRCLVRNGSDATDLEQAGAEIVVGDARDEVAVKEALTGAKTVVSSFATNIGKDPSVSGLWQNDYDGNRALIQHAKSSGAEKFVFVSYWGLAKFGGFEHGRIKKLVEDMVRLSGLDYTVLRVTTLATDMSMFTGENLRKRGWSVILMKQQEKIRPVLLDDLAWCVADSVDNPKASRRIIEVAGEEELTFLELEALFCEALGKKIRFVFVPHQAAHVIASCVDRVTGNRNNARGLVSAFTGGSTCDISEMKTVFDLKQKSFAAYLKNHFQK
jgi:uncharacterized protein YbjT (DUF2867 family)